MKKEIKKKLDFLMGKLDVFYMSYEFEGLTISDFEIVSYDERISAVYFEIIFVLIVLNDEDSKEKYIHLGVNDLFVSSGKFFEDLKTRMDRTIRTKIGHQEMFGIDGYCAEDWVLKDFRKNGFKEIEE